MAEATQRVLFLCTHNSARSQMAEGILRSMSAGAVDVQSAGTEPLGVHPLAVQVARDDFNIDISSQRSKHVDEFSGQQFDYIITLCDGAREMCPAFPGDPVRIHWRFDDPAAEPGPESERLRAFRRIARELQVRIRLLLILLERDTKPSPV